MALSILDYEWELINFPLWEVCVYVRVCLWVCACFHIYILCMFIGYSIKNQIGDLERSVFISVILMTGNTKQLVSLPKHLSQALPGNWSIVIITSITICGLGCIFSCLEKYISYC